MAEYGYEGATIARIVDEASVPESSVYHYFGSKDGVLLRVMERGADRLFTALAAYPTPSGDHLEKLTKFCGVLKVELESRPDFLGLVTLLAIQPSGFGGEATRDVVRDVRGTALDLVRRHLIAVFGAAVAPAVLQQLARFALASIDGAILANKADDAPLGDVIDCLPAALVAVYAALTSRR